MPTARTVQARHQGIAHAAPHEPHLPPRSLDRVQYRHRSGIAMRFPRINRLRWAKPPSEADRIEALEKLLPAGA